MKMNFRSSLFLLLRSLLFFKIDHVFARV